MFKKNVFFIIFILLLNACAHRVPSGTEVHGYYKIGTPYEIAGKHYIPKKDPTYQEEGIASWYGPSFHGNKTANGAKFNTTTLTAAHRTLPLPSMVRVTHLKNNKSVVVMVNDRGPFSKDRIIDVSKKTAELLDFRVQGTAKVRVEFLPEETKTLLVSMGLPADEVTKGTIPTQLANTKIPALKPTTSSSSRYVQVGTFSLKDNAQKIKTTLNDLGPEKVIVNEVKRGSTPLYRVQVGPWETEEAAETARQKVLDLGHPNALLVMN